MSSMNKSDTNNHSLWYALRPYKKSLMYGCVFLVFTNALDKTIPWFLKKAVDALQQENFETVRNYSFAVIGFAALMWAVRSFSRVLIFNVGRHIEFDLRNKVMRAIHRLGPPFFSKVSTGDVMSRATNDLGQVRLLVGFGALNLINSVIAYGVALTMLIVLSPKLTLMALCPIPIFIFITRWFAKAIYVRSKDSQEAMGSLSECVREYVSGIRLVRAFSLERNMHDRFQSSNQTALKANMRLVVVRGLMWPVLMSMHSVGLLIVIWQGSTMVFENEISVGTFAAFIAYLGQLMWPTLAAGYMVSVIQRGRSAYKRILELLEAQPEIEPPSTGRSVPAEPSLSIQNLSYPSEENPILKEIAFEVPHGSSLAIMGPTGSGKSTLVNLLPRLLPSEANKILIDQNSIEQFDLQSLRTHLRLNPQDPFLFSSSIEKNILFGSKQPSISFDDVTDAAKKAHIYDEIKSFPNGEKTIVGERGVQLSGGQKQRTALARAFMDKPPILILDDPLSAVDSETEQHILQSIKNIHEKQTLILVTHRVSAAALMDQVIVLEGGEITESGHPDELEKKQGFYSKIAQLQKLQNELEVI